MKSHLINDSFFRFREIHSMVNEMQEISRKNEINMLSGLSFRDNMEKIKKFNSFSIQQNNNNNLLTSHHKGNQLLGGFQSVIDIANLHTQSLAHFNILNSALNSISSHILSILEHQNKWPLITDTQETTIQLVSINERIINDNAPTKADLIEWKKTLQKIEKSINKTEHPYKKTLNKFFKISSYLFSLYSVLGTPILNPKHATEQEINAILIKHISKYRTQLKDIIEYRITKRKCKVFSEPSLQSKILKTIPLLIEVTVLQTTEEWTLISYYELNDTLLQTGWIMKNNLKDNM